MEKNIRLGMGAAALVLGLFGRFGRSTRIAAVTLGAVEITTALTGYCPMNQLIGRNSCGMSIPDAARNALEHAQQFAE